MRNLAIAALLLIAACDQVAVPGAAPPPLRPGLSETVGQALCQLGFTAIPLRELRSGHHLVEVSLNGQPATFVVDTGANVTVLDAALAEKFGLKPRLGLRGAAVGLGGSTGARQWSLEELRIGPVPVRQGTIVTTDLSQVTGALSRLSDQPISGIVGQDVMKAHQAVIDVAGPTLHLVEPESGPKPAEACDAAGSSAPPG
ncbi:retropepsin-like aspartic protease [Phenylobacterium terrae]|uniref:Retropepsin-like aspartic protease n=1 Tax=Phenylobacterium terrae TaxID=2665495 RepID=A0ABW4N292_9CAUL